MTHLGRSSFSLPFILAYTKGITAKENDTTEVLPERNIIRPPKTVERAEYALG